MMALATTEPFVARAEQALGCALPAWLRARLLRENGGTVAADGECWELFSVLDTTDRKRITRSATHIVGETITARRWPGFPPRAMAIARNGGGDYLVLLPEDAAGSPSLQPALRRWRHGEDGSLATVAVAAAL